jgi:hypothetical protein
MSVASLFLFSFLAPPVLDTAVENYREVRLVWVQNVVVNIVFCVIQGSLILIHPVTSETILIAR